MGTKRGSVRIEETGDELAMLRAEFDTWIGHRIRADERKQHVAQFDSLRTVVEHALERIGRDVGASADELTVPATYERCRRNDERLALVRRLWEHYRERWDQRDGPLRGALRAADTLVWSCHETVVAGGGALGLAPLASVAPLHAAAASRGSAAPHHLRSTPNDELLAEIVGRLPAPLISLPPACSRRAWRLGVVAHEVGHLVCHGLDGGRLRARLPQLIETAATAAGGTRPSPWSAWADELFADAFAALALGPAAAWELTELLIAPYPAMTQVEQGPYPPPRARVLFTAAVLEQAGLPGRDWHLPPSSLPAPANGAAAPPGFVELLSTLDPVAGVFATDPLVGRRTLPQLVSFASAPFAAGGKAAWWHDRLLCEDAPNPGRENASARLTLAGAIAAWAQLTRLEDEDARRTAAQRLSERAFTLVGEAAGPEPTRALPTAPPEAAEVAQEFAERLFATELEAA